MTTDRAKNRRARALWAEQKRMRRIHGLAFSLLDDNNCGGVPRKWNLASRRGALATRVLGHLLVTMSIAASGEVMVSMVGHAEAGHAPYPASLLLSSSIAVGILALILMATALADWQKLAPVYRAVSWA